MTETETAPGDVVDSNPVDSGDLDAGTVAVGTELPSLTVRLTRADLVRYAGASTDFNPIHYSERFAAAVGLPGVIAHGLLTMGLALRVVTDWVGNPALVRTYFVRFTKPVVVPDDDEGVEVVFSGTVTEVQGALLTIALEARCGDDKVLGAARAEVELPPAPRTTAETVGADGIGPEGAPPIVDVALDSAGPPP
jgi:acyl dehydratase